MATTSTAIATASICRNCGHERKDHSFDDGCWQEVESDKRVVLCTCPGFKPVVMNNREASVSAQEWDRLFREALGERDNSRVLERIAWAEGAIRQRMAEVKPSDGREWQRLRDALQTLKFIKAPL